MDQGKYEEEMAKHEVVVEIRNEQEHKKIVDFLHYDQRNIGSHGLSLSAPVTLEREQGPCVKLEAGDRVEPSVTLQDVHEFENLNTFPFTVTFWRKRPAAMTHYQTHGTLSLEFVNAWACCQCVAL